MLLDSVMPEYEFGERHHIPVGVTPARALEAAELATPGEMPIVRLLFEIRSLPARLVRKRGLPTERTSPLLGQMLGSGFVLLAREPGVEVVAGVIAAPWRIGGLPIDVSNVREFVAFEEPGYVKATMNFLVAPEAGGADLLTETRVQTTDDASRRAFARYWGLIRSGSAEIRRGWLRAAKRRAERGAGRTRSG